MMSAPTVPGGPGATWPGRGHAREAERRARADQERERRDREAGELERAAGRAAVGRGRGGARGRGAGPEANRRACARSRGATGVEGCGGGRSIEPPLPRHHRPHPQRPRQLVPQRRSHGDRVTAVPSITTRAPQSTVISTAGADHSSLQLTSTARSRLERVNTCGGPSAISSGLSWPDRAGTSRPREHPSSSLDRAEPCSASQGRLGRAPGPSRWR
jgi:hypothetical protein